MIIINKIILKLIASISSILACNSLKCNAYVNFDEVQKKYNVNLFEFNSKFREDNIKNVKYVEACTFDKENSTKLIWDSGCIFYIPFPERIGEIYERDGCVFESVLAHVGWHQAVGAWKSVKGNLILVPSKLGQQGMDGNFSCLQSSKEEFDNSMKNISLLFENQSTKESKLSELAIISDTKSTKEKNEIVKSSNKKRKMNNGDKFSSSKNIKKKKRKIYKSRNYKIKKSTRLKKYKNRIK